MTDEEVIRLGKVLKPLVYDQVVTALTHAGIKIENYTGTFDENDPLKGARWDDDSRCYIGLDGRKYDSDGEELVPGSHADDWDDVAKLRARYNPNK